MSKSDDLSRCQVPFDQQRTLVSVIEMSKSSWLVSGIVPGLERQPLKKLEADEKALLGLINRWADEARKQGQMIERIVVAFETGRDGFWLARYLSAHGIEAHVMHAASVAVSRENRRAKTDRLDTELLNRAFLGWLRGEREHCKMAAIPTLEEEDAKRPGRERERLVSDRTSIVNRVKSALARLGIRGFNPKLKKALSRLDALRMPEGTAIPANTLAALRRDLERLQLLREQIKQIEAARLERLQNTDRQTAWEAKENAMVKLLARVLGIGIETADKLVREVLYRNLRDRRAVAKYGGLTGAPNESGKRRRERGLSRSGNARVRTAMIEFAWRFLRFQKGSALAQWFEKRTGGVRSLRKKMIVALARKLLIALWRLAHDGVVPDGIILRPAS